ncbi:MAG: hypothetical protein GF353_29605 [Candidatus Lokiarchaeota archaeon]|nr:hypothetical protein [Candidatus Lokiarchaeota archaeon]
MFVGRAVVEKKMRVDGVRHIDILELSRRGLFEMDASSVWWKFSWKDGDVELASIGGKIVRESGMARGIEFFYTVTDGVTGASERIHYEVPVVSTPCNYGGRRWWFVCNLQRNGGECNRRCRILYLPGRNKYFGCRECYELTYESRQRHREKFYETFEKPYAKWQRTFRKFMSARSPERVMQLKDEMDRLMAIIHGKDSFLNFGIRDFCDE